MGAGGLGTRLQRGGAVVFPRLEMAEALRQTDPM
jgi:hypothetical protein